ncbi:MAG TPA: hypothetical protein VNR17_15280 [Luteimicrobium sp.]|nr:hypothetical protein [Luteimicrobium sp.]
MGTAEEVEAWRRLAASVDAWAAAHVVSDVAERHLEVAPARDGATSFWIDVHDGQIVVGVGAVPGWSFPTDEAGLSAALDVIAAIRQGRVWLASERTGLWAKVVVGDGSELIDHRERMLGALVGASRRGPKTWVRGLPYEG